MKHQNENITTKQPLLLIEPDEDYGLWENLYGRKLSAIEKCEIEANLTDFFGILIDEDKRIRKAQ